MNTEVSNETSIAGRERQKTSLRLDQATLKNWLTTEIVLTLPRWALVASGAIISVLSLIALD